MNFEKNLGKIVLAFSIGIFALIIGLMSYNSTPTGSRGVVTQFGEIVGVRGEGLNLLPPWQRLHNMSIRAERADIENAEGSTSDTQPVKVSMTVRYSLTLDKVAEVYEKYSHTGDMSSYIQTATQEVFKSVTAKFTAPELISKRDQVSLKINSELAAKMRQYGVTITSIDMRNFSFSAEYMKAINDKVTQEQLKLVAENKLRTVEMEQRQKVVIADAEAEATLKVARAEAESLRIKNNALAQNKDVLELKRIEVDMVKAEKWNGALPSAIYAGAPVPFLKVDK